MSDRIVTANYNIITEHIIVGTSLCFTTLGNIQNQTLEDLGISVLLNLRSKHSDFNELPKSDIILPKNLEAHLWIPIIDDTPPTIFQAKLAADLIDHVVKSDRKIYVHCKEGIGRAPTIVASYLILKEGYTAKKALEFILSKRPVINPVPSQVEFLEALEKSQKDDSNSISQL